MCILLEHANHKELLTSTNNGVKTLEIAVTILPSGRRDVVLAYYTTKYVPKDIQT